MGSAPRIQQRRLFGSESAAVQLMPWARRSGLKLLPEMRNDQLGLGTGFPSSIKAPTSPSVDGIVGELARPGWFAARLSVAGIPSGDDGCVRASGLGES